MNAASLRGSFFAALHMLLSRLLCVVKRRDQRQSVRAQLFQRLANLPDVIDKRVGTAAFQREEAAVV